MEFMWYRRRTPFWVWILAFLGLKSLWWRPLPEAERERYREKRRRFREKLAEAFDVWREPEEPEKPHDVQ